MSVELFSEDDDKYSFAVPSRKKVLQFLQENAREVENKYAFLLSSYFGGGVFSFSEDGNKILLRSNKKYLGLFASNSYLEIVIDQERSPCTVRAKYRIGYYKVPLAYFARMISFYIPINSVILYVLYGRLVTFSELLIILLGCVFFWKCSTFLHSPQSSLIGRNNLHYVDELMKKMQRNLQVI